MHGTLPANPAAASSPQGRLRALLVLRLAARELRAGLAGFAVFIACIALGVGAISGVAAVARSLVGGISEQGRVILGGDASFALIQREASPAEQAFLAGRGRVSSIATLRAMAVAADGGATLVEAKAVDAAYPQVGAVTSDPAQPLADLLAERGGVYGALADPALFDRLGLAPGARITVGTVPLVLRARLVTEPDRIATGIGFGPRLLLSEAALRASGLVQPGSLVRWIYRVVLPGTADRDADVANLAADAGKALPSAGWDVRTRLNADPRFQQNIERFAQFVTLVGLTTLLVGGVGVANAVSAFVDRKRVSIGILKSIGATGGEVVAIYLVQVLAIAALGTAIGLGVGAAIPYAVSAAAADLLPIPIVPTLSPTDLGLAILYGLLTAFAFSVVPLGRAHDIPVSTLFRDRIAPAPRLPRLVYAAAAAIAGLVLVAIAVAEAQDRRVALIFVGTAILAFGLLRVLAWATMALARRLPHPRNASLRLALANLHRPGALTPSLVLSLGLGITLLVTVAVIDGNLTREITRSLPERAPNFFFLDVPSTQSADFQRFLAAQAPGGTVESVPMMRGRITAMRDRPVSEIKAEQEAAWVLEGDRGITYADAIPEGSSLTAGTWWPADYRGPPLVSFDGEMAHGLGVAVGDSVTVNVLGRPVTAKIANLRRVDWRRLGINFVMVFSPNSFAGAPHTDLMTVSLPKNADPAIEPRLVREIAKAFPGVTSVRVKDALDAFAQIVSELVLGIRLASLVALVASLLVLAGALAAGHRARLYDAVVLKTLGATRPRLLAAYATEYGAIGLITALFALAAGTTTAYFVVTRVMRVPFTPALASAAGWALGAVLVAVVLGLAGTWRILGQKPASYLREL